MKWRNDEYKDLKYKVFDLMMQELVDEKYKMITIKKLSDEIDLFIKSLLEENE
ncbi:MAG: hypothetical protein AABY22_22845 [Nanoarchaeota archaeon]